MRVRLLLVSATVLAASAALPALAKPLSCRLVTDARGDTVGLMPTDDAPLPGSDAVPADGALDIVSADMAANRRVVTAVVRVADLGADAATSPAGSAYLVTFVINEARYTLYAMRDVSGARRFVLIDGQDVGTSGVVVTGHFDPMRNEVRITASYDDFTELGARVTATSRIVELKAFTQRALGIAGSYTFQSADGAGGRVAYRFGTPSCVTPGH
jgi:hypothetical protein